MCRSDLQFSPDDLRARRTSKGGIMILVQRGEMPEIPIAIFTHAGRIQRCKGVPKHLGFEVDRSGKVRLAKETE